MTKIHGTKQLRGRGNNSTTLELTLTAGAKDLGWIEGDHIVIKAEDGKLVLEKMGE